MIQIRKICWQTLSVIVLAIKRSFHINRQKMVENYLRIDNSTHQRSYFDPFLLINEADRFHLEPLVDGECQKSKERGIHNKELEFIR